MSPVRVGEDFDPEPGTRAVFDELDRVRLRKSLETERRALPSGLEGTIVLCHGNVAFEVEFNGIYDFFEIY
jgi:hypothetical protein